ncbi:MAG: hypothetical protein R2712_17240 [Vicinamibacterales bacterium]
MFVAANAAFRSAWREIVAGRADASVLDGVLQAYAAVLRADPDRIDAAFNLELVAERQDQVARQRPIAVTAADDEPRDSGPIRTSDLPVGPTIHGLPGGPPVNVQMEEFEILIPREAGQEETEPGRASGRRVRRKG